MRFEDFPAVFWDELYKECGFTDGQLKVIEQRRQHGRTWDNRKHANELKIPLRTYNRRIAAIKDKIICFMAIS